MRTGLLCLYLWLQARMALVGSDAAKAALAQLDAELVLPPGYTPCQDQHSTSSARSSEATGSAGSATTPQGKPASAGQRKQDTAQQQGSVAEELQKLVADVSGAAALSLSRIEYVCAWTCASMQVSN
jgi:hypothetical protein